MAALTDIVGPSLSSRVRAEHRTYCALQFATVVAPSTLIPEPETRNPLTLHALEPWNPETVKP